MRLRLCVSLALLLSALFLFAAPPAAAQTLTDLTLSGHGTSPQRGVIYYPLTLIPEFSSATKQYRAAAEYQATHVRVKPEWTASSATVTAGSRNADGQDVSAAAGIASSGRALNVNLVSATGSVTTVYVKITVSGTTAEYTIAVRKDPSPNANLSGLTASSSTSAQGAFNTLTLTPAFSASRTSYTATVANNVTHVKLTPTVADTGKATVTVQGSTVTSGTASDAIALSEGVNALTVQVKAQSRKTKDYTVTVTRQLQDANLSGLTASSGTSAQGTFNTLSLTPAFSATTTSYTATVANHITHVKLTPTVASGTVTVQGATVASGTASDAIALSEGANTLTVQVATQGRATRDYTVTVTRQPPNANLSGLTASSGTSAQGAFNTLTLTPAFSATTTGYTATVAKNITHVKLTPTVADTGKATVTVQGATVTSGTASDAIALSEGANALTVQVTAQDGTTTKDYTVTVTRQHVTLVSNQSKTSNNTHSANGRSFSQGFTTGAAIRGYTLASIEALHQTAGQRDAIRAELWSATTGGAPAAKLADLKVPSTAPQGWVLYAARANTVLSPSTTYHFVIYTADATSLDLWGTTEDSEDGLPGWSLADSMYSQANNEPTGTWSLHHNQQALKIIVKGSPSTRSTTTTTPTTGGGGGGGTRTPADRHGDTPATATVLTPAGHIGALSRQIAARLQSRRDVDYFTLTLPYAGVLTASTTGADTTGRLYQAQAEGAPLLIAEDTDSGRGTNFRLGTAVEASTYYLAVSAGRGSGDYRLSVHYTPAAFGNPAPDSFQSGVSVLSGWVCDADTVAIELVPETGPAQTWVPATGTARPDTAGVCGAETTDTGYGLLFNWNRLGDGAHTVRVWMDDVLVDERQITVTTLGPHEDQEFRRDLTATTEVADFPAVGETTTLRWEQARQNFMIASGAGGGTGQQLTPTHAQLGNPAPGSFQSGVGVVSGWACAAETVEITFETAAGTTFTEEAGYGTTRPDTEPVCGDTDNGFGLLVNWNRLGTGQHTVRALADGEEFAHSTFTVTTLGAHADEEFRRGLRKTHAIADFPAEGQTTTVEWQTGQQNFMITGVE